MTPVLVIAAASVVSLIEWWVGYYFGYRAGRARGETVPDGFVHRRHVEDPEHYDELGRYRWWGA